MDRAVSFPISTVKNPSNLAITGFPNCLSQARNSKIFPQMPSCSMASYLTGWAFPQRTAGTMNRAGSIFTIRWRKLWRI